MEGFPFLEGKIGETIWYVKEKAGRPFINRLTRNTRVAAISGIQRDVHLQISNQK